MSAFECPGIAMPQPVDAPAEGFVACWRAGHECPRFVAEERIEDNYRTVSFRCPCCGQHGMSMAGPVDWDMPEPPESIHTYITLDGLL